MTVQVVVGNPRAGSRTARVALAVAEALSSLTDHGPPALVELAELAGSLFDPGAASVDEALAAVAASRLVVVASPTYKATYTGLLKAFFDRYGNDGLAGVVAVPIMTGAAPIHALAVEVHLRPLLVELGASVPSRGLYVTEDRFDDLAAVVGPWAAQARPLVARALEAV